MINSTTLRTALSAAAVVGLFSGSSALAQQQASSSTRFFQGLYLSGAVGAHTTENADLIGPATNVTNRTDWDFAGLVGVGLELGDTGFRVEIEGGYRPSSVDSISGSSGGSGDVDAYTAIANVFYDINLGEKFDVHLGGGLGVADVDYDNVKTIGASKIDKDDFGWAWQLGAGAGYALNERLTLTLDYRFLNIEGLEYSSKSPNVGKIDADYRDHAFFVGVRFLLNEPVKPKVAPAPAPKPVAQTRQTYRSPPPPAPEPTRDFIVFFDWDQSVITAEAAAILRDAAATAKKVGPVRIVATGHADRSGPADYNRALSERRALAVRGQLQQFGIDPSTVSTFARGETDPLVPTPDGVREPQNRRVEIVLQ